MEQADRKKAESRFRRREKAEILAAAAMSQYQATLEAER
jgi:hypothetical protein